MTETRKPALRKSERRRCRAEIPYVTWTGFTGGQCAFTANQYRVLRPEHRKLPVCGVHARAKSLREYRATNPGDAAVEAVVR